ncbi:hypothetical protein [Microbacterium elymi]|uniref:Uncharacterized protein n=1 Tax=Microbacterium elymi TaxID=2909587 RepID=A0ABY5NKG5_9MICO|nr:hypothetical protein [Microbacterium elymi]UUT35659.1 hypothetical protein L2X98_20560 [Microbacterium elymi]
MITFLIRALIFLVSAALGLIVADLVLPGFVLHWSDWWGFVLAIVIFAILQSILAPWLVKISRRHAPALLGGIGLVSTFVALLIAVPARRRHRHRRPCGVDLRHTDRLGGHGPCHLAAARAVPEEEDRRPAGRLSRSQM